MTHPIRQRRWFFSAGVGLTALALALASSPGAVWANPTGGTIAAGNASISSSGAKLTVTQTSQSAVIDWRGFDINQGETTNFVQPSSSSITLNRVNSPSASFINGALNANGNIVIVNQNGVLFGKNAMVDVNSLLVTSADIDNPQFMAGNYAFNKPGNPNATIQNQGLITAKQAGLVGLVAPNVLNSGVITARLGTIHIASGDSFTVDLYGDNLMSIQASPALQSQLVQNRGKLNANGGTIAITAAAAGETVNSLIEVSGTLNANAVGTKDGSIYIYAEGSNAVQNNVAADKGSKTGSSLVTVSGTLSTTSNTGSAGTVNLLGDAVVLSNSAVIDSSGSTGGGTVNIGGQQHGAGTTPTALSTTIEAGASINASALQNGTGGTVTVWSDRATTFNGTITAQGGARGGNGGSIETSSHGILSLSGMVQANAVKGKAGTWLLDPSDVTIVAGVGTDVNESTSGTPVTWTPSASATSSTIYAANINNALSNGTSVVITTSSAGNITVSGTADSGGAVSINVPTATSLTLSAANNITTNAGSSITGTGTAAVTFTAGKSIILNGGLTLGTGTLTVTGGGTGSLSGGGAISSSGATIFTPGSGSGTLSGVISGTGSVTLSGGGILTLSGANSYSGGTTVSSGTLATNASSGFGTGTVNLVAPGSLSVSDSGGGNTTFGNTLTGTGTVTLQSTAGVTSTIITGDLRAFMGTINAGTAANQNIRLSTPTSGSANAVWNVVGILTGEATGSYSLGALTGTGQLAGDGSTNTVTYQVGGLNTSTNFSGTILDIANATNGKATALTKVGSGTLTLSGTNGYSGGTTVSAGTLAASSASAFGTGAIDVQTAGTLSLSAPSSSWPFSNNLTADAGGNGTVTLQSVAGGSTSITIAGDISQFKGTINIGTATDQEVKLSGTNSFSANALWNVTGVLMGETSGQIYSLGAVTGSGGLAGDSGSNGNVTFSVGGLNTTTTFSGRIGKTASGLGSGTTALTKVGTGTLILTGTNTYSNATTVSGGTLQIGNGGTSGALSSTSSVTDNANLVINRADSSTLTLSSLLTSNVSGSGNFSVMTGGGFTVDKTISLTGPASTLAITAAGTVTVSSAITNNGASGVTSLTATGNSVILNGGLTISTGTLTVTGGGTGGISGSGAISSSGSTVFNPGTVFTPGNGMGTLSGVISGTGSVTMMGSGTLTLSGTNSYSGGTTVSSGTLVTPTTAGFGSGTVNVGPSGTLFITTLDQGNANTTFSNTLTGSGTVTIQSYPTLTSVSIAGDLTAFAGTINAGTAASQGIRLSPPNGGSANLVWNSANAVWNVVGDLYGQYTGTYSLGALTGTGNLAANNSSTVTYQVGGLNSSTIFSGIIENKATGLNGSAVALTKVGTGTLTLTGTNTYTGATTVSGGTLQIGNGGTSGALTGTPSVTDNANLVINRADSSTLTLSSLLSSTVSGSGNFSATTGGAFTVDKTIALTGASSTLTIDAAGALTVNSAITNSGASGMTILAAGYTTPVGTATGGDVTLTAGVTVANSGTVTVFSGDPNTNSLDGEITGATGAVKYKTYDAAYAALSGAVSGTRNYFYRTQTVLGITAANKIYDGTTAASVNFSSGVSTADGDVLAVTAATGTFASANVGTGLNVSISGTTANSINSGWSVNSFTFSATTTANITSVALTVTGETANNKPYDSTTTAVLSGGTLSGVPPSDSGKVTLIQAGSFSSPHSGTGIAVTAADSLSGSAAGNYTLTQPTGLSANITPESITVTAQANSKPYDGTTSATTAPIVTSGKLYAGDGGTLTETYGTANAGLNLTLTPMLSGLNTPGDYTIQYATSNAGVINQKALTVTNETVTTKIYDNTTTAMLSGGQLVGVVHGDNVTLTEAGSFSSPHAGTVPITVADTISGAASTISNYTLTQPTLTGTITPEPITVTAQANIKTYDGTTNAVTAPIVTSGKLYQGVGVTLTQSYGTANAGLSLTLTPTVTGLTNPGDYTINAVNSNAGVITPLALTVTGETANNKIYDSTTAASLSGGTLSGVLPVDSGNVTLIQAGSFSSPHAGTAIPITVTDSLIGAAAGNYTLTQPANLTATITPEAITVRAQANSKTYDGTTSATTAPTVTSGTLYAANGGLLAESYASANAGTNLTLTPTLSGLSNPGDYTINYATSNAGVITQKALTVTGETANNKIYDGTTAATLSGGSLSGVIGSDNVTLIQTGSFSSANAGIGIAVIAADSLTGSAAGNYTLTQPVNLSANITPKALTVTGETANNKSYDGTTTATLSGGGLSGVVAGDAGNVTLTQSGSFASANAGTGIAVTAADSLSGSAAGNYTLTQPANLSANITPAAITVTAQANSKSYDGTTSATASPTVTSGTLYAVNSGTLAETYASANAGTGLTLIPTLTGLANAADYKITYITSDAGVITQKALTVTGETANNKIYDGTTTATLTGGSLSGVVAGDAGKVTLTQAGSFASANVGTAIAVTAADSLSGSAAGNYTLTQPVGLGATITPKTLTVTGETANNKIYDGTTIATLTGGSLSGVVAGDAGNVTLSQAGSFVSANAGTGIAVTAADSLSGSAAGNYILAQPAVLGATITPKTLTVTGETANNKTYDSTTAATLSGGSLSGVLPGDAGNVTLIQAGNFSSPNVATAIAVTAADSLSGSASANYALTQPATLSANIAPEAITVTAQASTKIYDGTTRSTTVPLVTTGTLYAANSGTLAESYASADIGTGLTMTPRLTGLANAADYNITYVPSVAGSIVAIPRTISVLTQNPLTLFVADSLSGTGSTNDNLSWASYSLFADNDPTPSGAVSLQAGPQKAVYALSDLDPEISRLVYLDVDISPALQGILGYNFKASCNSPGHDGDRNCTAHF